MHAATTSCAGQYCGVMVYLIVTSKALSMLTSMLTSMLSMLTGILIALALLVSTLSLSTGVGRLGWVGWGIGSAGVLAMFVGARLSKVVAGLLETGKLKRRNVCNKACARFWWCFEVGHEKDDHSLACSR